MIKIILTDPELRKTFDVYNILRELNISSHVIICSKNKKLKNVYKDAFFIDNMSQLSRIRSDEHCIFLPIEEKRILEIYDLELLNIKYLLPHIESFEIARNKSSLMEYCRKLNCPHPYTYNSLKRLRNVDKFPIIAKKKIGEGAKGQIIIKDSDSLKKFLKNKDINDYVIQELIPGDRVIGAFYLYKDGKLVEWLCHKRIRTYPIKGGVSVLSECFYDDSVRDMGKYILDQLNWSGLAMLEFIYDERDSKYKLIEINPRIWGSILLTSQLIIRYIELLLNYTIPIKRKQRRYINWIFPGELLYFLSSLKPMEMIKNCIFILKNRRDINFINISYANIFESFLFLFFQFYDKNNFKKFLEKLSF